MYIVFSVSDFSWEGCIILNWSDKMLEKYIFFVVLFTVCNWIYVYYKRIHVGICLFVIHCQDQIVIDIAKSQGQQER